MISNSESACEYCPNIEPLISCIVCTHRHPELLDGVLKSLVSQKMESSDYEIIVVDNCSGDWTPSVVSKYETCSVAVRYVYEPRLGLSVARNRGIVASKGSILAFTDDDTVADPLWLPALLDSYRRFPLAKIVGGPVVPLWEAPRPEWLADCFLRSLSIVDWGNNERYLVWPERLIGANMSFRAEILKQVGSFAVDLGRKGRGMGAAEDTEIQKRVHDAGEKVLFSPRAIIQHRVPAERMRARYFYSRAFGHAMSTTTDEFVRMGLRCGLRHVIRIIGGMPRCVVTWTQLSCAGGQKVLRGMAIASQLGEAAAYLRYVWRRMHGESTVEHQVGPDRRFV